MVSASADEGETARIAGVADTLKSACPPPRSVSQPAEIFDLHSRKFVSGLCTLDIKQPG
jgi:hypothetical protein